MQVPTIGLPPLPTGTTGLDIGDDFHGYCPSFGVFSLALEIDGAPACFEVQSQGLRHGPAAVMAALARGEAVAGDAYYFCAFVRFTTGAPSWAIQQADGHCRGQRLADAALLDVYRLT